MGLPPLLEECHGFWSVLVDGVATRYTPCDGEAKRADVGQCDWSLAAVFPSFRIDVDATAARASGSPLVLLLASMEKSLAAIGHETPEAGSAHIVFTADEQPVCQADDASSARVSMRTLEFLWCISHGLLTFYQGVVAGRAARGEELDLNNAPRGAEELRMALGWALNCLVKGGPASRWPPVLDAPDFSSTAPLAVLVREVATVSALTLVLHEVSHIERWTEAHTSLADEARADAAAVDAVMTTSALSISSTNRGLGVAVAFLFDLAPALWTGDYDGIVHPKSYRRLVASLTDAGDSALALLSATLPLLMEDRWKGYRPPAYEFKTHLEAVLFFSLLIERVDEIRRARRGA